MNAYHRTGEVMSTTITWLGHASFRLTLPDQRVILVDPWLRDNPTCPEALKSPPRCDLILLTHGHGDHIGDVANLIEAHDPMIVGNFDLCAALEKQIGRGRFSSMGTGGTQSVEGINVSLTQAHHGSGIDSPSGPLYGGMPNGVVVAAPDVATVYHAGDTDVFSDMRLIKQLFDPKICILPIGDHFTMGAKGAALAAEMLEPKTIIPCHYKTFPMLAQSADGFREALPAALRERLIVPEVGQELAWA